MTGPQKFSLSLLISTVIFAGFALWSYAGLYTTIETSFFRSRVEESVAKQVKDTDTAAAEYLVKLQSDLQVLFGQDYMVNTFRTNQAQDDILARKKAVEELRQKYSINSIRLFDQAGLLHDSTRLSDIKEQTPAKSIEWLPKSELQSELPIDTLLAGDSRQARYVWETGSNQMIWSVPVKDAADVVYGTAVVYANLQQLTKINEKWARTSYGERFRILEGQVLLINMPSEEPVGLVDALREGLKTLGTEKRFRVTADTTKASWYAYVNDSAIAGVRTIFLVDATELEFPPYMRFILLGIVFLTVFLIAYLLLNLRHDEMVVLSDRIKRLQINVLKQYVDRKDVEGFDGERWQNELKARRVEVHATIKQGLRRRQRKDPAVDDLIDKEWDEIIDVLGGRRVASSTAGPMDLSRLEELVEKVISNYQNQVAHLPPPAVKAPVVSSSTGGGVKSAPAAKAASAKAPARKAAAADKPLVVPSVPLTKVPVPIGQSEPADAEDLEEMEEIEEVEEAEDLDEAEALDEVEAAEEIEEVEEVGEVEEAEDAEEVAEAEEVGEAEELDEVEAAEEAEELDEVEAADEIEEVAEADEVDEAEEVAEAEEVDEAEELDEVEAAEEAEELDEVEAADEIEEVAEVDEVEEAEEAGKVEEAGSAEEPEEPEELEEVEAVDEAEELDEVEAAEEIAEVAESAVKAAESIPIYDDEIPDVIEFELENEDGSPAAISTFTQDRGANDPTSSGQAEGIEPLEELDELDQLEELEAGEDEAIEAAQVIVEAEAIEEAEEILEAEELTEDESLDGSGSPSVASTDPEAEAEFTLDEVEELAELEEVASTQLSTFGGSYQLSANALQLPGAGGALASLAVAKELEYLASRGKGSIFIKELSELVEPAASRQWTFQELDEGVVQIPDSVFNRSAAAPKDAPFGELVESIIKDAGKPGLAANDSEAPVGTLTTTITNLLGFSEKDDNFADDDLTFGSAEAKNEASTVHVAEHRTFYRNHHDRAQNVIITPRGVDLDYFLQDFRPDEGGKIKAMYSFSKRFKAESAVLVRVNEEGLQILRTLGVPHQSGTKVDYRDGGDSLADLVTVPAIVMFRSMPVITAMLSQHCWDPAIAKMIVWVPVVYENELAYCIFGYSQLVDLPGYLAQYIEILPVDQPD